MPTDYHNVRHHYEIFNSSDNVSYVVTVDSIKELIETQLTPITRHRIYESMHRLQITKITKRWYWTDSEESILLTKRPEGTDVEKLISIGRTRALLEVKKDQVNQKRSQKENEEAHRKLMRSLR